MASATKETPAEVAAPELSLEAIKGQVEDADSKRSEAINKLRTKMEWHEEQANEIRVMLTELGQAPEEELPLPSSNGTRGRPRGSGNDGKNGKKTIKSSVEALVKKSKTKGVTRGDICSKMISEMGYKLNGDSKEAIDAFNTNVYGGGINKLDKEGRIVATGQRPKVYKHVEFATLAEKKAAGK